MLARRKQKLSPAPAACNACVARVVSFTDAYTERRLPVGNSGGEFRVFRRLFQERIAQCVSCPS